MSNVANWEQILSKAGCALKEAKLWAPYFAKYAKQYKLTTAKRIAAFLANVMIESQYLRVLRENLRYSAKGLSNTWPNRYGVNGKKGVPNAKALELAGKPQAIANHTYANRMGNGNEASGDGWKYAGKGPIQVTGKDNFVRFLKANNLPLDTHPDRLMEPELGTIASMHFWDSNNINRYADIGDFDGTADLVNIGRKTTKQGDAHGFASRQKIYFELLPFLTINERLFMGETQTLVIDNREMEKRIPPEIHNLFEDPDGEFMFEFVQEFKRL